MSRSLCFVVISACLLLTTAANAAGGLSAEDDARMGWWRDAKFGMFIHWGVYAVPAGEYNGEQVPGIGEWIMRQAQIPVEEYRGYAKQFVPSQYDPQAWAALAKQAGMNYVVITAKHHDGFSLYDSAVTKWDIADASPYGKDLLAPLAKAVRSEGLKFGLYYSQAQDWTHPGGAKAGMAEGTGWDDAHAGDFDQYLQQIALPQTKEILARYQPDVLWWDTPIWMNQRRAQPLHDALSAAPGIITNNRLGGGYHGDTETPEQHIPATGFKGRDWETCMTMNDTWGFKRQDQNWKSTQTLIHNLVDIVSKGGNYLLNVGPTADGRIPQESIDRLQEIGRWMDANGDAIYGTTASPCRRPEWGRITRKGDRLFLCVFDWPEDGVLRAPVAVGVRDCRLMADPAVGFTASSDESGLVVQLAGQAVDPICTVVELGIEGEPEEVFEWIAPDRDGRLTLLASDAATTGHVQVEAIGGRPNLGYWTEPSDEAAWRVAAPAAGRYRVEVEVAAPVSAGFSLEVEGAPLAGRVTPTAGFHDFRVQDLGEIDLPAGRSRLVLHPKEGEWQPINLRSVVLTPVR